MIAADPFVNIETGNLVVFVGASMVIFGSVWVTYLIYKLRRLKNER